MNLLSHCPDIISLHYFLWFGGQTAIFGYIDEYSKTYANTLPSHFGLLNMVLPFLGIVTKLLFCTLADRYRAHRICFIVFVSIALAGYMTLAVLPAVVEISPEGSSLKVPVWATICLAWTLTTLAMSVISSLSDTFAMHAGKKRNTSYSRIRLWGTLGWGASSLLLARINSTNQLPFLVPGLIMTVCFVTLDLVMVVLWPDKNDFRPTMTARDDESNGARNSAHSDTLAPESTLTKDTSAYGTITVAESSHPNGLTSHQHQDLLDTSNVKVQWLLFKEVVIRRRSIFSYMTVFVVSGALISLQWSYLFRFLKDIYPEDFAAVSGVSMLIQSMLGELPFFLLSDWIIKVLGRSNALGVSIITIGIRFLLYEYVLRNSSYYFILLTEPFAGPNFGLFYVVMTDVGLDYSNCDEAIAKVISDGRVGDEQRTVQRMRQALRATMQALMSACYEGLGVGIGSLVGGYVIEYHGFSKLWLGASTIAIILGATVIIADLLKLPLFWDQARINTRHRQDESEASHCNKI